MATRIIAVVGASIAIVAGMYIFGKLADKGGNGAKEDSPSRDNAA